MDQNIFWVWNGWGILFTSIVILWQFLHILVTIKIGPSTPIRNALSLIMIVAVLLTFIFSGWVAGLLAIPIGMTFGIILAKILVPNPYA